MSTFIRHKGSQDFVGGALFFPKKLTIFSRRPQNTS